MYAGKNISSLTLLLVGLALPMAAQVEKITPCDLAGVKLHQSKMVSMSGTIAFDMHGARIYSPDCRPKMPVVALQVPNPDTTPSNTSSPTPKSRSWYLISA